MRVDETAYRLDGSSGGNVFMDNVVLGGSVHHLARADLSDTDVVRSPIVASASENDIDFFGVLLKTTAPFSGFF